MLDFETKTKIVYEHIEPIMFLDDEHFHQGQLEHIRCPRCNPDTYWQC